VAIRERGSDNARQKKKEGRKEEGGERGGADLHRVPLHIGSLKPETIQAHRVVTQRELSRWETRGNREGKQGAQGKEKKKNNSRASFRVKKQGGKKGLGGKEAKIGCKKK